MTARYVTFFGRITTAERPFDGLRMENFSNLHFDRFCGNFKVIDEKRPSLDSTIGRFFADFGQKVSQERPDVFLGVSMAA